MATFRRRGSLWQVQVRKRGLEQVIRAVESKWNLQAWARKVGPDIEHGITVNHERVYRLYRKEGVGNVSRASPERCPPQSAAKVAWFTVNPTVTRPEPVIAATNAAAWSWSRGFSPSSIKSVQPSSVSESGRMDACKHEQHRGAASNVPGSDRPDQSRHSLSGVNRLEYQCFHLR